MKKITRFAKENRKKLTPSEKIMKANLLQWKIRFRTQRMFDFYIVDFLIPDKRIAIEVDGEYHKKTKIYDKNRQTYLENLGLKVIRIENQEVLTTNCQRIFNEIVTTPSMDIRKLPFRLSYGTSKY